MILKPANIVDPSGLASRVFEASVEFGVDNGEAGHPRAFSTEFYLLSTKVIFLRNCHWQPVCSITEHVRLDAPSHRAEKHIASAS